MRVYRKLILESFWKVGDEKLALMVLDLSVLHCSSL